MSHLRSVTHTLLCSCPAQGKTSHHERSRWHKSCCPVLSSHRRPEVAGKVFVTGVKWLLCNVLVLSFCPLQIFNSFEQMRQNVRDLRNTELPKFHEYEDLLPLLTQERNSNSSFSRCLVRTDLHFKLLLVENTIFAVHSITCFFDWLHLSVLLYEDPKQGSMTLRLKVYLKPRGRAAFPSVSDLVMPWCFGRRGMNRGAAALQMSPMDKPCTTAWRCWPAVMAWNRNNQVIQTKTALEFIRVVWLPVPKPSEFRENPAWTWPGPASLLGVLVYWEEYAWGRMLTKSNLDDDGLVESGVMMGSNFSLEFWKNKRVRQL